ncbi:hypothetical protein M0805_009099 [Coniferiporia weirii]|nr:hypothetical protein M0805_009099 [Coniferiporia weirii]
MSSPVSPSHFLSLPRPDSPSGLPAGVPDTTTVAAHDFDVDASTGFMPSQPPLARLPALWEPWEAALEDAIAAKLKLGGARDLTLEDEMKSEEWRSRVKNLPVLPTYDLKRSEITLRRAHHVLTWTMHFYINTLPPSAPVVIPRSISVPLLEVSGYMALPPLLTYSDDVLYNWKYRDTSNINALPTLRNITVQTTFTSTPSEAHFYLTSAYIELRGAAALSLMSLIMDEAFVRDAIALRRIVIYLRHLANVINELEGLLIAVREGCDPEVFYHDVRPWFKGQDSMQGERRWVFEGVGEEGYEHLKHPTDRELSGPSAGQSSLIHAIDIFLGVENHTPAPRTLPPSNSLSTPSGAEPAQGSEKPKEKESFLARMQSYMPRHHRAFLQHLAASPRPLRALVAAETADARNPELLAAYNAAVDALRTFRNAHLRIVALFIVGPARRIEAGNRTMLLAQPAALSAGDVPRKSDMENGGDGGVKGTGGTNAMTFLKGVRDRTADAILRDGGSGTDLSR